MLDITIYWSIHFNMHGFMCSMRAGTRKFARLSGHCACKYIRNSTRKKRECNYMYITLIACTIYMHIQAEQIDMTGVDLDRRVNKIYVDPRCSCSLRLLPWVTVRRLIWTNLSLTLCALRRYVISPSQTRGRHVCLMARAYKSAECTSK